MNFKVPRPPSSNGKSAAGYLANHWWLIIAIACLALVTLAFSPFAGLRSKAAVSNKSAATDKAATASSTSPVSTGKAARQTGISTSDGIWEQTGEKNLPAAQAAQSKIQGKYRTLRLNKQSLAGVLANAPLQNSSDTRFRGVTLSLPLPDGSFGTFRILDSPIMEPALAARHPEVKTYSGIGVDDPTASTRFSWTPNGFEAIILSASGTIYIVPAVEGNSIDYVCYSARDIATESSLFHCDAKNDEIPGEATHCPRSSAIPSSGAPLGTNSPAAGATLRTYRLAIATTGEFTKLFGGGDVNATFFKVASTV